ncbi:MAG: phage major tail protein, TP901-1 family [Bacillota bacterium]|nr:phage major tail protein, TP901-1 family [Bacillota bacterium]
MASNPQKGKRSILAFRRLADAGTKSALKLALQTSHSWNMNRTIDNTQTKDGNITSDGGLEVSLSIEAISSYDEVNTFLEESVKNGDKLEVWEIDLDQEGSGENAGKFAAKYAQGQLNSWSTPSDVGSFKTISTTMSIDGTYQEGFATLSDAEVEEAMYAFRDTTPVP